MAKRGTLEHPKNRRLARALKTNPGTTLGLLETIWHRAAQYHPDGGMTRLDLEDAFDAGGWLDVFTVDSLIAALTSQDHAWLEALPNGTWYIHDWHIHCDDSTQAKLYRAVKYFANGVKPIAKKVYGDEKHQLEEAWKQANKPTFLSGLPAATASNPADTESSPPAILPSLAKPSHSLAKPEPKPEPVVSVDDVFQDLPQVLISEPLKSEWRLWEKYLREVHSRPMQPMCRGPAWSEVLKRAPPGKEVDFVISTIRQAMAAGWKNLYPQEGKPHVSSAKRTRVTGGDAWGDAKTFDGSGVRIFDATAEAAKRLPEAS